MAPELHDKYVQFFGLASNKSMAAGLFYLDLFLIYQLLRDCMINVSNLYYHDTLPTKGWTTLCVVYIYFVFMLFAVGVGSVFFNQAGVGGAVFPQIQL